MLIMDDVYPTAISSAFPREIPKSEIQSMRHEMETVIILLIDQCNINQQPSTDPYCSIIATGRKYNSSNICIYATISIMCLIKRRKIISESIMKCCFSLRCILKVL